MRVADLLVRGDRRRGCRCRWDRVPDQPVCCQRRARDPAVDGAGRELDGPHGGHPTGLPGWWGDGDHRWRWRGDRHGPGTVGGRAAWADGERPVLHHGRCWYLDEARELPVRHGRDGWRRWWVGWMPRHQFRPERLVGRWWWWRVRPEGLRELGAGRNGGCHGRRWRVRCGGRGQPGRDRKSTRLK